MKNEKEIGNTSDFMMPYGIHGWGDDEKPRIGAKRMETIDNGGTINLPKSLFESEKQKIEKIIGCPVEVVGPAPWGQVKVRAQVTIPISIIKGAVIE